MKKTIYITLTLLLLGVITSCELHDKETISITHKAVVHLRYHYPNGKDATLDDVQAMRLFIYDRTGSLYRDTTLTRAQILADTGVMQTYLSSGDYTFVSWANVGQHTIPDAYENLQTAKLLLPPNAVPCLMYGKSSSPIVKGDSLIFDIDLFKSVFKVNVQITGLEYTEHPEAHYFSIDNREFISFDNTPCGDLDQYHPAELVNNKRSITGTFYTPFFHPKDDFHIGVYCDHPQSQYTTLCETSIQDFAKFAPSAIGGDVEINVNIHIQRTNITIVITDWEGVVIQEQHLGK